MHSASNTTKGSLPPANEERAASSLAPADPPNIDSAGQEELKRQLVENESQRTEVRGYINQLNIQIHRWQLRLQKLNERNTEIKIQLDVPEVEKPA
jgi:hypothetical protein